MHTIRTGKTKGEGYNSQCITRNRHAAKVKDGGQLSGG